MTRKKYSEELKRDAVRVLHNRGPRGVREVAAELGVSTSMLHRWQQTYGDEVVGASAQAEAGREDVEQLRRRLRELVSSWAVLSTIGQNATTQPIGTTVEASGASRIGLLQR